MENEANETYLKLTQNPFHILALFICRGLFLGRITAKRGEVWICKHTDGAAKLR